MSDLIGIVKLPIKDVEVGSKAVVSGWGTKINPYSPVSKVLQKLTLDIISYEKCKSMMPSFAKVHTSHICTFVKKGKGSCSVRNIFLHIYGKSPTYLIEILLHLISYYKIEPGNFY